MQKHLVLTTLLLAITAVAACSTVPENSHLNEARNAYNAVQGDPQVVALAPNELKQAGDALDKANAAANKKEDEAVVAQLAYLARQRVAIAQQTAIQKRAEQNLTEAVAARNEIRLSANGRAFVRRDGLHPRRRLSHGIRPALSGGGACPPCRCGRVLD